MQQKLERFALAHQLIQDAFIKKIRSYIQQVSDSQLELPELVIIAIALEACLNELLTGNAPATRMIENITYIADRFFAQNITPEKLDFFPQNNDPRPLALLAEYFTLEDTLEIFQELPEKANLAFISAWEPDFISQEKKRKDRQLRNDDTQELCELFGFGFYISDDTISNFNKLSEQLPDTLCILDGETFKTFKNEQWHYFSETFFIMNQPAELERFIDTYNEIFSFSRDPEHILEADNFHERNLLLSKLYNQLDRRLLTNFDNLELMHRTTPAEYAVHLQNIFDKLKPDKAGILIDTDIISFNKVVDKLSQRLLNMQSWIKSQLKK